eukprot:1213546-Prymnesium_polylepis.1
MAVVPSVSLASTFAPWRKSSVTLGSDASSVLHAIMSGVTLSSWTTCGASTAALASRRSWHDVRAAVGAR